MTQRQGFSASETKHLSTDLYEKIGGDEERGI